MCYTLIPYWLTPEVCHTESDDSSASCCCFSQLLNGMVSAAEGACGTAGDVAGDAVGGRGGTGVAVKWLSLDRRLFNWVIAMAVVVGVGSRDGAKVGTQVRIPPWPDAARHVRPDLYFAFSASGSAFQRWPGAHLARVGLGKSALRRGVGGRGSAGVRAGARARAEAGACPIAFLGPSCSSRAAEAAAAHGETRCRGC